MMDGKTEDSMVGVVKSWDKSKSKKVMTMDEVADHLADDFEDEIHDSKKYLCMAKVADHAGNSHDSHYLMEMAKDEYTHARFIRDFMEEHDMEVPEDQLEQFEKLEKEIEKFF